MTGLAAVGLVWNRVVINDLALFGVVSFCLIKWKYECFLQGIKASCYVKNWHGPRQNDIQIWITKLGPSTLINKDYQLSNPISELDKFFRLIIIPDYSINELLWITKRVLIRCLRIFSWVKNQVKNVALVLRSSALYIVIFGLEVHQK